MKRILYFGILLAAANLFAANSSDERISKDLLDSKDAESNIILIHAENDDDSSRLQREAKVHAFGGSSLKHFPGLGVTYLHANRALLEELRKDGKIRFIAPDRKISASASGSDSYNQTDVRTVLGLTSSTTQSGSGVGVAVIDSGVNNLVGFGTTGACATSRVVYIENFASDGGTNDLFGHGTHVASILASNAACDETYSTSAAPSAKIINLRVLNALGAGSDSAVISAIDRAIALKSSYNIRVMNLSLGRGIFDSFVNDPLCQAVERAWKAGIVVVVAAGNMGRYATTNGYATIASPANDPFVITVGAVRDPANGLGNSRTDDTLTSYSSKGPSMSDHIVKPDLVAPGNLMVARTVFPSTLTIQYPANVKRFEDSNGNFFKLSGTSMATPVVAAAAALLIQKDSSLTPDQVKARLMKTAWKGMAATSSIYDATTNTTFNVQQDLFAIGAGYVDVGAALASSEKIGSTQSAISPRAIVLSTGKVQLTSSYPNLTGLNVVWGSNVVWGENVVWGSNVLLANNVVWGDNVVWGTNVSSGYNVVWGSNVVWGDSNPFSMTLTAGGDN